MTALRPALLAVLLLAGCDRYPVDTEGTLERVSGGTMRIGVLPAGHQEPALRAFVARLAERVDAKPEISAGAAEPLLLKLESGDLDLVVGPFDRKTPWMRRVTFSKPIAHTVRADATEEIKAATRNGEHAWAMEVDRTVARLPGAPR